MPSVDWNRTHWRQTLADFRGGLDAKVGDYGNQWGFVEEPPLRRAMRALLIDTLRVHRIGRIRKLLHRHMPGLTRPGDLRRVADEYLKPYVHPESTVLEIGPGGGRWTQYLLDARQIILVDLVEEFFPYLRERFADHADKLVFYRTDGAEMEGVVDASVDFVFSFGVFVHVEPDDIERYLAEIERVLRPGGRAAIQYANKDKAIAARSQIFSDMNTRRMAAMVEARPRLRLAAHDVELLAHSNIAVIEKPAR